MIKQKLFFYDMWSWWSDYVDNMQIWNSWSLLTSYEEIAFMNAVAVI